MIGNETWRKKDNPNILVEAVRLTEDNVEEVAKWCRGELVEEIDPEHPEETQFGINLLTPEGTKRASLHMYVVGLKGLFFVSNNRHFETVYEPAYRSATPLESAGDTRKRLGFADPFGGPSVV